MISVVIPTLNAGATLPACLSALAPAALSGLVREVVVSDGGSQDGTRAVADAAGVRFVAGASGRGAQLARGADAARKGSFLLFLHADTVLDDSWAEEASRAAAGGDAAAFVFTLAFDDDALAARLVAAGAMARTRLFASPYGDQGLLLSRALYDGIGGYRPMPLFEDVDIVDRIVAAKGRRALRVLRSRAVTSAARYRRDGYVRRVLKNLACLSMYRAGAAPEKILAFYRT